MYLSVNFHRLYSYKNRLSFCCTVPYNVVVWNILTFISSWNQANSQTIQLFNYDVSSNNNWTNLYIKHRYASRFNPATLSCLFRLITWITICKCRGLLSTRWFNVRGGFSFCWYWWKCWPSLFIQS